MLTNVIISLEYIYKYNAKLIYLFPINVYKAREMHFGLYHSNRIKILMLTDHEARQKSIISFRSNSNPQMQMLLNIGAYLTTIWFFNEAALPCSVQCTDVWDLLFIHSIIKSRWESNPRAFKYRALCYFNLQSDISH